MALATALLALTVGVAACGGTGSASGGDGSGGSLTLVAYSTPQEAYEEIIPAFNETPPGKDVGFDQSYGASGDQSRAIVSGLEADLAALSLEPDVTKLVDEGLVPQDWNQDKFDGFVTNSLVVFAVRKGNPENIQTWDDLVTGDVEIITPNPFTSGGAQWNLMAAYGAQLEQGKSEEEALEFLSQILENTPVQDKSAREALQTFVGGKGDVLLSYENEAIAAQQAGEELDYVIPEETILIENPVAVIDGADPKAQAFRDFLFTEEAQRIFQSKGYRPVLKQLHDEERFPTPEKLFEIGEFGGWDKVRAEFFDPENGSVAQIEEELGVSTSG
ncbi:MAG TPA: sulfate ABC transporter substrate-binding protein [Thermoleophilaceae bacterium]|nr:sulfate ABC transporter substrate-binding protein [Thermoleophilaceae bacterium]